MDDLSKQLWNLMDDCRGSMEVSHTLELLTYVTFIAKENPESFQTIVNTGHAKQLDMLTKAGKTLKNKHPSEVCMAPNHYRIDAKIINLVVSFIANFSEFKPLANAIREYHVQAFGKLTGEFSANQNMVGILTALVGDCSKKTVFDGACGLARISSSMNSEMLYLEEKNHSTYVTVYRLLTLEDKQFNLANTNSLLKPAFNREQQFDVVVMEPPMAQKFSADERRMLAEAPFIRVPVGKAVSANSGDSLWIQQALSNLNDTGKGYIVLPQGFLFRGGYDAKVRDYLLGNELLEAVIGLPASVLSGTSIAPTILVLNKDKQAGSPIVFVDASEIGTPNKNSVSLSKEDTLLIANLAAGKLINDERFNSVFIPEISQQNNELSISRYIIKKVEVKELDITQELKILKSYQVEFEEHQQKLTALLEKAQIIN